MHRKLSMEDLNRSSLETYKNQKKLSVIMVLEDIRSMNNIGSVFRTADAFAIEKIILVGISAQPPHKEITKTALGADESVDWQYFETIDKAIESLKVDNYTIAAVEQTTNSKFLNEFSPSTNQKIAFIFGNEVFGVSEKAIELSDLVIEIPQYGTKHSLNISVTAGIVCWDMNVKLMLRN